MTNTDERKILDYISQMTARFLVTEEGVKKRELCYQLLVGCLVILPVAINQAVAYEKLRTESTKLETDLQSFVEENSQLKREIMELKRGG
jgi:cell division protein FtsB